MIFQKNKIVFNSLVKLIIRISLYHLMEVKMGQIFAARQHRLVRITFRRCNEGLIEGIIVFGMFRYNFYF